MTKRKKLERWDGIKELLGKGKTQGVRGRGPEVEGKRW